MIHAIVWEFYRQTSFTPFFPFCFCTVVLATGYCFCFFQWCLALWWNHWPWGKYLLQFYKVRSGTEPQGAANWSRTSSDTPAPAPGEHTPGFSGKPTPVLHSTAQRPMHLRKGRRSLLVSFPPQNSRGSCLQYWHWFSRLISLSFTWKTTD